MKCAFYHYILYISLIWIRIVVSEIISSDFIQCNNFYNIKTMICHDNLEIMDFIIKVNY